MSEQNDQPQTNPEAVAEQPAGPTLEEQLAEAKDRLLRALAETENVRRQKEREVDEARRYAVTNFARGLLEVSDNLARALAAMPADARDELRNLVLGVELTERTLLALFEKYHIAKVIPAKGDKFDHNRHQAMFELPSADLAPGTIAEVMQPGYVISDRLLRPAMVGVAKAAPTAAPAGGTVDQTV